MRGYIIKNKTCRFDFPSSGLRKELGVVIASGQVKLQPFRGEGNQLIQQIKIEREKLAREVSPEIKLYAYHFPKHWPDRQWQRIGIIDRVDSCCNETLRAIRNVCGMHVQVGAELVFSPSENLNDDRAVLVQTGGMEIRSGRYSNFCKPNKLSFQPLASLFNTRPVWISATVWFSTNDTDFSSPHCYTGYHRQGQSSTPNFATPSWHTGSPQQRQYAYNPYFATAPATSSNGTQDLTSEIELKGYHVI